eukprot:scaffold24418_cov50-Attheya_sp.AAC.1
MDAANNNAVVVAVTAARAQNLCSLDDLLNWLVESRAPIIVKPHPNAFVALLAAVSNDDNEQPFAGLV